MAAKSEDKAEVQFVDPSLNVYDFQEIADDSVPVKYQVVKMEDSVLIWIGTEEAAKFSDLSLAIKTPYDSMPAASRILGDSAEDVPSLRLASMFTKKLNKPVYVSFNITPSKSLLAQIEKRLSQEIKTNPDAF